MFVHLPICQSAPALTPSPRHLALTGSVTLPPPPNWQELYRWPAVQEAAKAALDLRYRLLPYFYTLAQNASETGHPLLRALWMDFPRETQAKTIDRQAVELVGLACFIRPAFPVLSSGEKMRCLDPHLVLHVVGRACWCAPVVIAPLTLPPTLPPAGHAAASLCWEAPCWSTPSWMTMART